MNETKTPEQIIADTVWSFCIREGKPATAKDIAVETGRSSAWVRKYWHAVALTQGIVFDDAYVERRERSYGTRLADQRVDALRPTWEALATRLRAAEQHNEALTE